MGCHLSRILQFGSLENMSTLKKKAQNFIFLGGVDTYIPVRRSLSFGRLRQGDGSFDSVAWDKLDYRV